MDVLRKELIGLLTLLQTLQPVQIDKLLQFVCCKPPLDASFLNTALNKLNEVQLQTLIYMSQHGGSKPEDAPKDELLCKVTQANINCFGALFNLHQLQQVQKCINIEAVIKLREVIPSGVAPEQKFHLLKLLQQILNQFIPGQMLELRSIHLKQGVQIQELYNILGILPTDQCVLELIYQPFCTLLRGEEQEIITIHEALPKFTDIQLNQICTLLPMDPFEYIELWEDLSTERANSNTLGFGTLETQVDDSALAVRIIDQPPERTVYKRNLRPNPSIIVTGDPSNVCAAGETLYVVPVLVRCDNEAVLDKLTGDMPIRVAANSIITFKRLKIMVTSHQQEESLLCIRFELRKYAGQNDYKILSSIQTNPITVVSHSTLLKQPTATIQEVCPAVGSGGTKVAIIGRNFSDSKTTVVRFDTMDVIPTFHGAGTLIVIAPEHEPGIVPVRVSNDSKKWSDTAGQFKYAGSINQQNSAISVHQDYATGRNNDFMQFDTSNSNFANAHVYNTNNTPFGATNSQGRDGMGNTPLHFAVKFGKLEEIVSLVKRGAQVNAQNDYGYTPLHIAVSNGNRKAVYLLLRLGANISATGAHGETPLHLACGCGHSELAADLLKLGAPHSAIDNDGECPLHWCSREGLVNITKLLLSFGSNADSANEDGETPLHIAAISGAAQVVQVLSFARNKEFINQRDATGATALVNAQEANCFQSICTLLNAGATTNITCANKSSADIMFVTKAFANEVEKSFMQSRLFVANNTKLVNTCLSTTNTTNRRSRSNNYNNFNCLPSGRSIAVHN